MFHVSRSTSYVPGCSFSLRPAGRVPQGGFSVRREYRGANDNERATWNVERGTWNRASGSEQ